MESIPSLIPVLPIRNAVLFPTTSMPIVVGRSRSTRAIERANQTDRQILVIAQQHVTPDDPSPTDLYRIGTLARIEGLTASDASGGFQIMVTGLTRFRVSEFSVTADGFLAARGEQVSDQVGGDATRSQALTLQFKEAASEVIKLLQGTGSGAPPGASEPLLNFMERVDDPSALTNVSASYLNLTIPQKQTLLETANTDQRMELLLEHMKREREVMGLQREIRDKMSQRLSKAHRDALLREQLRTIREELGEDLTGDAAADELEQKIQQAGLPEEAQKVAHEELKRLKALPAASAEYHVVRTYLDLLLALPWNTTTQDNLDLEHAEKILNEDHYGLQDVKKRILQHLAVARLKKDLKGSILCLVGPPGVGKTSLGQSIARALGRKFIRLSLGGVRDEAEIRGHRKTYVGAMPGRLIQTLKRAGSRNPVMILDEMDKLGADFRGDPSAALLEVLDPEQNHSFVDHYLDTPFGLQEVFFIATANVLETIPHALKDRLEIIELSGYTLNEKLHIARRHLIPKQLAEHGLENGDFTLSDEVLKAVITQYTREAGCRDLQRKIAALCRSVAMMLVSGKSKRPISIELSQLDEHLGVARFLPEVTERQSRPGVVTGLAWTAQGGDILFIEASRMPGRGVLTLTGQLGDVMKESAQIALSLVRSMKSQVPSLKSHLWEVSKNDIHIHVPAGATPKDGPSAGVTLFSALVSLALNQTLDPKLAMTGEVTLRGAVLPVGGIREKLVAAHRAGVTHVILPKRNEPDLKEVPDEVKRDLHISFASNVEELVKNLRWAQPPKKKAKKR